MSCHCEIAAEWQSSLHRRSWHDLAFLSAYALEPQAFCRSCHVPEADPQQPPSSAARALGVGCVTCHVRDGHIIGARPSSGLTHAVTVDKRLAAAESCANCHQFAFPKPQPAAHSMASGLPANAARHGALLRH